MFYSINWCWCFYWIFSLPFDKSWRSKTLYIIHPRQSNDRFRYIRWFYPMLIKTLILMTLSRSLHNLFLLRRYYSVHSDGRTLKIDSCDINWIYTIRTLTRSHVSLWICTVGCILYLCTYFTIWANGLSNNLSYSVQRNVINNLVIVFINFLRGGS